MAQAPAEASPAAKIGFVAKSREGLAETAFLQATYVPESCMCYFEVACASRTSQHGQRSVDRTAEQLYTEALCELLVLVPALEYSAQMLSKLLLATNEADRKAVLGLLLEEQAYALQHEGLMGRLCPPLDGAEHDCLITDALCMCDTYSVVKPDVSEGPLVDLPFRFLFSRAYLLPLSLLNDSALFAYISGCVQMFAHDSDARAQLSRAFKAQASGFANSRIHSANRQLLSLHLPARDGAERNPERLANRLHRASSAALLLAYAVGRVVQARELEPFDGSALTTVATQSAAHEVAEAAARRVPTTRFTLMPLAEAGASHRESKRGSQEDGMRFLLAVCTRENSAFSVPAVTAPERVFNEWFDKLKQLPSMFELDAATILTYLVEPITSNNKLMYGWDAKRTAIEHTRSLTLHDFFAHVHEALFASPHARQDAWTHLCELEPNTTVFDDCHALAISLQQAFARLFPAESTVRVHEAAPVTVQQACLKVHQFLARVRLLTLAECATNMQVAWSHSSTSMHALYTAHLRNVAMSDYQPYLSAVCSALDEARDYAAQVGLHLPHDKNDHVLMSYPDEVPERRSAPHTQLQHTSDPAVVSDSGAMGCNTNNARYEPYPAVRSSTFSTNPRPYLPGGAEWKMPEGFRLKDLAAVVDIYWPSQEACLEACREAKLRGARYCVVCKAEEHQPNRRCPPVAAVKAKAALGDTAQNDAWEALYAKRQELWRAEMHPQAL